MDQLQQQFRTGKWTFLLDGRVVEWFYEGSSDSGRAHVDHLRIDGEQKDDGLKVRWGIEVSGTIVNGGRVLVPTSQVAEFESFVAMAIANRTTTDELELR